MLFFNRKKKVPEDVKLTDESASTDKKNPGYFSKKKTEFVDRSKRSLGVQHIENATSIIRDGVVLLNPMKYEQKETFNETFRQSCERFGIRTEADLFVVYKGLFVRFYCLAGVSFFILLWSFYQAFIGNFMVSLGSLGILSAALASVVVTSYRLSQIYERDWFDFKVFLANSELWFPKNWNGAQEKNKKKRRRSHRKEE